MTPVSCLSAASHLQQLGSVCSTAVCLAKGDHPPGNLEKHVDAPDRQYLMVRGARRGVWHLSEVSATGWDLGGATGTLYLEILDGFIEGFHKAVGLGTRVGKIPATTWRCRQSDRRIGWRRRRRGPAGWNLGNMVLGLSFRLTPGAAA
jgi:hypothetical protein